MISFSIVKKILIRFFYSQILISHFQKKLYIFRIRVKYNFSILINRYQYQNV